MIKEKLPTIRKQCLVDGCCNTSPTTPFIGDLCFLCYMMLSKGELCPSTAWFVKEIEYLEDMLFMYEDCSYDEDKESRAKWRDEWLKPRSS